MIGEHTVKSQRPRSVHDTKALQEQAESAKFMAQTGNTIVMFLYFILLTKLNFIMHALSCTAPFLSGNVLHYYFSHSLLLRMN